MSDTIVLIDGMYLTFSSFYANSNMRTLKGEPTGAVYGFVTRVERLIKDFDPRGIMVALDSKEKTFRHKLYNGYKAKRLKPPEELIRQLPHIKDFLKLRGIDYLEVPGYEADDIIAILSRSKMLKDHQILIFSADKDLFQLVGGNVYLYHPRLKKKMDASDIKESFGVSPRQIVDYLSLAGDSSDNIPGVPGIGDKTAKKLIETYSSLDELIKNIDSLDEKVKQKIISSKELLELSKKLVDLSVIPDFDRELSVNKFDNQINSGLASFYKKLSFNSLLKELQTDLKETKTELSIEYKLVTNKPQLGELKKKILEQKYFSFDIETTGVEFFKSDIVGISISFQDEGYYIPFRFPSGAGFKIDFGLDYFKREMDDVFGNSNIKKSGHNLKFDLLHLKKSGIKVRGVSDDSMLMAYLLFPNRRAHNLKDLTFELLDVNQLEYKDLVGKGKHQITMDEVDVKKISHYCIDDSILSLKIINLLEKRLTEKNLNHLYNTIEIPLIEVLLEMEFTGVKIDADFLKNASQKMYHKIKEVEETIYRLAGFRFNINSSQQLGELLFEKMNLPVTKRTRKTKSYSTDIEVLNELKGIPVVEQVINYRTYKKMLSTYLEGLINSCDSGQRVHTSFNQTVTATGRLSSSNPNLQNIPVGELAEINLRKAFIAEGSHWYLLSADYSQIELRVMAHFSEDQRLTEAFSRNADIHQHTADTVFGKESSLNALEKRKRAKIINFSILYGSGAYSLSKELGVSYSNAKDFIDRYYEKYAGVKDFIERVVSEAEKNPEVETISGRRRGIPEILSSNRTVKENGKRMAINTIIQGSAADIIKIAMVDILKKLRGMESKLILQVHDELVFEYPESEEEELCSLVKENMEKALPLKVPLKVSLRKGKNWGEMKKII